MPGFKPSQFEIHKEPAKAEGDVRVVKVDGELPTDVQAFVPNALRAPGQGQYGSVRSKFGALAATDPERASRAQKDSRFAVSPLLREPLAIEQEERRVIEEKVRERIAAVSEDARRQAAELGFEEGFQKGYEEAQEKVRQESRGKLEQFDALLAALEGVKAEIFRANERFLMELIFRIGKMVLMKELQLDKDYVSRLCRELVERVGARENIRIKISPQDVEIAGQLKADLEAALGALKNLTIEPSSQVEGGGCVVETAWNAIDASIETQFRNVHETLIGER